MNNKTTGIIALIILTIFLTLMAFQGDIEYHKNKDVEKKVIDMNCSDLNLYLKYFHVIEIARHQHALSFCEDFKVLEDREVCLYMEKQIFEVRPYNVVRSVYEEKCGEDLNGNN
jgi:hypothetical protein